MAADAFKSSGHTGNIGNFIKAQKRSAGKVSANPKTTTLAQKLVQITGEIAKSRIEKNGTNEYHRYKYVKASDVAALSLIHI